MSRRALIVVAALSACTDASTKTRRTEPTSQAPTSRLTQYPTVLATTSKQRSLNRTPLAKVTLPERAKHPITIEDTSSHTAMRFVLEGVDDVPLVASSTIATAANALGSEVDVVFHVRPDGVEDFLLFPSRPTREHARYRVELPGAV